ncbi:MAG TPA: HEAT repeat domain-containing protein, partial [Tepidisphaeraceae bacterium]
MTPNNYYREIPPHCHVWSAKNAWETLGVFAVKSRLFWVVMALMAATGSPVAAKDAAPATQPLALEERVDRLINELRSDDAATRQSAEASLIALGSSVRPEMLKLVKSDDPELQQEAAQILLNLPWYEPDDPPEVKSPLSRYATADIGLRRDVVRQLADLDQNRGTPALLRLLCDDPSPAVQWTVVTCLREQQQVDPFRAIQPPADDSRILALCGYALLETNPIEGVKDLRQCAKLELANPTDDDGEFDFVIHGLADEACLEKHYDEAADWRRKECMRGSPPDRAGV